MKIGVIGLGSIGLRHAKNLVDLGHEVYGYDPIHFDEPAMVPAAPEGVKVVNLAKLYDEVEAVVIASPTREHLSDMAIAMTKGCKSVFVEKPIAHVRIREPFKNVVMVGNNLRFHSCVKQAKAWMELIGTPIWASFTVSQYSDKPAYKRDGVILNWGAHEIDLALYLLGPAAVGACIAKGDNDEMADIILMHKSGTQSAIHLDYLAPVERRGFCIVGTNGNIGVDLVQRTAIMKIKPTPSLDSRSHFLGEDGFDDNYIEEMKAFVDRIEGKETLGATGADGLSTLEICLKAREMAGL